MDLYDAEIGSKGISALASYLKENTTLKELNLVSNNIDSDGAECLAQCLGEKSQI